MLCNLKRATWRKVAQRLILRIKGVACLQVNEYATCLKAGDQRAPNRRK